MTSRSGRQAADRARAPGHRRGRAGLGRRPLRWCPKESLCEPVVQSNIWSYWEGIALDHVRLYIRERKGAFAFPASDGTVLVAANLMHDEFVAARRNREAAFHARLGEVAPDLRDMLPGASRVERFHGGCTRAFVREAAGPGWALVGDAGMKKDPVTAQGISTAFRCAEMLAEAADDGLSGRRPLEDALAVYGEGARLRGCCPTTTSPPSSPASPGRRTSSPPTIARSSPTPPPPPASSAASPSPTRPRTCFRKLSPVVAPGSQSPRTETSAVRGGRRPASPSVGRAQAAVDADRLSGDVEA